MPNISKCLLCANKHRLKCFVNVILFNVHSISEVSTSTPSIQMGKLGHRSW